jgi:hypothetical protein
VASDPFQGPAAVSSHLPQAEVTVQTDTYQITVEDGITVAAPRTTSRDIKRHKASDYG